MNFILFDGEEREGLLPFTFTRPVAAIRTGILTMAEKWERNLGQSVSYKTQPYLQVKYPLQSADDNILINGAYGPEPALIQAIHTLQSGEGLYDEEKLIACRVDAASLSSFDHAQTFKSISYSHTGIHIRFTYDIFSLNDKAIREDFELLTRGRMSEPLSDTNQYLKKERIFIEPGAKVEFSILNATDGPIYIGKDAEVMEGCKIRGPFALCEHGGLKMDAKIYGATTVGPYCKVGGEVTNSVFFGYSNKGHDGFIGNSVIGEWCNLGADTNNSNLKNTYEEVKLWSYRTGKFEKTGLTFCGLIMGDHSKCGINTMFNTGTVVGVAANIFGSGFPRNFIPSFAWGGAQGFETFQLKKMYQVAVAMCSRRNVEFTTDDQAIIDEVFRLTATYRLWEKNKD
ncbi:MAG: GlmU family protein [Bacteroidia bacterium]|jgi:UDP-N-acetylglucosamine diphosphorylase/glucosamine-1-phosphate N-acetyltransferase